LARLRELRVVTRSLNFFHAIPDLYDGAGRRRAIERSQLLCASAASSAYGKRTARTFLLQLQNALRPRYVRSHNIARDLSVTIDVGFCQIGNYQAIRFAA
jgi:hypothetical protein